MEGDARLPFLLKVAGGLAEKVGGWLGLLLLVLVIVEGRPGGGGLRDKRTSTSIS